MAHKTLINGTSYEITGGRTLVNGTGYEIKSGKTLVGGTAYEVGFGQPVTITVTGAGLEGYVEIIHNGTTYHSATTFSANVGDTIRCELEECWNSQYLYINGVLVDGGYGENDIVYDYVVTSDAIIELYHNNADEKRERDGVITITEIRNDPATITITGDDADYLRYASVTINGTSYNSGWYDGETVSVEVGAGAVISCSAKCPSKATSPYLSSTYISVNGTKVITATAIGSDITYDYVVTGDATIRLRSREKYSNVVITET